MNNPIKIEREDNIQSQDNHICLKRASKNGKYPQEETGF